MRPGRPPRAGAPPLVLPPLALALLAAALLAGPPAIGRGQTETPFPAAPAASLAWDLTTSLGYDTYVQRFPLAGEDTTETISEFELAAAAEGRTEGRARHHWRLRPELSVGTELTRERLEAAWQYRPDSTATALRLDAWWQGRQYRGGTAYSLRSDWQEGRVEARAVASPRGGQAGEVRLYAARLRYAEPTELALDQDEAGGGVFWRAGHDAERHFLLGARLARRAYPDSAAVDRTVAALEGEYDSRGFCDAGLRAWAHAERRRVRDESVRPSAWAGWGGLEWTAPAGAGRLEAGLLGEVWDYDAESSVWFDSWRLGGTLVYRGGDALDWRWLAGLAAERLDAGPSSPETYNQAGVRAGLETIGERLIGELVVEVGRRDYVYAPPEPAPTAVSLTASLDDLALYSDFTYWSLWLTAAWTVTERLGVDASASWQPEDHTEEADDSAVAFGFARLVWRW